MDNFTLNESNINTIEKLDLEKITDGNKGFTTYRTIVVQNIRDPIALAVWTYLASLPPDWTVLKSKVRDHFNIGINVLDRSLRILSKLNLILLNRQRNPNGTLGDSVINVKAGHDFTLKHEIHTSGKKSPSDKGSNLTHENHRHGNHAHGKQHLQKKHVQNKDFKEKNKTKSSLYKKAENQKRHAFADNMNQKACKPKASSKFWEPGNPDYDRVNSK